MALKGTSGNDTIDGTSGDDIILGLEGDDSLSGGNGDDRIVGGLGADTIWGGAGVDTVFGGAGDDLIEEGGGGELHGGKGFDTLHLFYGTFFGTSIDGFEWSFLVGGAMTTPGGSAADGFERVDITGSDFDDVISGGRYSDTLRGWEGNDSLYGGRGNDFMIGDNGDDQLSGGKGSDSITGGGGSDLLIGGDGEDTLIGGSNSDVFSGDDTLIGGKGADDFYGGRGTTTISYADSKAGVYVNIPANEAHGGDAEGDQFFNGAGGIIIGSRYADTLMGAGNMDGGQGDDRLVAQWGTWSMTGGQGADVFAFTWDSEILYNHPVLTDFHQGQDTLDLSLIDARAADGDQAFIFIGTEAFTGRPGEVRYEYDAVNDRTIVEMSMNQDANAEHSFYLQGEFTLTEADFVL